ncbi:MAG: COX15/CtaA family protein, partial [Pseudomonadota bacterium]
MKTLRLLAWGSVGLALTVVVLGAWVRLSHAGLGCPDWPGCYGEVTWPDTSEEISIANEAYPERPVSIPKAWKEMLHRYVAGSLMLLVYGIAFL